MPSRAATAIVAGRRCRSRGVPSRTAGRRDRWRSCQGPKGCAPQQSSVPNAVGPTAVSIHAVSRAPFVILRAEHEREREAAQPVCRALVRFSRRDHEEPCIVIDAVAVFLAAHRPFGMFEQAAMIAHAIEVIEREAAGPDHVATNSLGFHQFVGEVGVSTSDRAPTERRRESPGFATIDAIRPPSHRTDRIASAKANGSAWGTTMPAPLLSSSIACGNAVAITGRPAAIASTSTPEVTWSRES